MCENYLPKQNIVISLLIHKTHILYSFYIL